jgi:hypothetical protein
VAQRLSQSEGGGMETHSMTENNYGWTLDGPLTAIEPTGVEFIAENGGNAGVGLRKT